MEPGHRRACSGALLVAVSLGMISWAVAAKAAPVPPPGGKHRLVVMTDIGGDPDDRQSMVRFLLYACDFDVEGLCTGFGHGHYKQTRPDLIHAAVDAYGKVLPNLRKHRGDYPSYERLKSLIKDGHNGDPHKVGPGMDSEASEWIIRVLDRDDPRPVWFSIWGGPRELAQAIWKVQTTRSAEALKAFKRKIRVHSIADQDRTAGWVKTNHPDVFWIFSNRLFRGIWKEGDQAIVSPAWLEKHVRTGHGPLGPLYPAKAAGKDGVKEGDTPSFLYVLPDGLGDPSHPEWGNWGGRFRRSGRGNEYIPAEDLRDGRPDLLTTIHRWRPAFQNAFEARMDWCVRPGDKANHKPTAVLNGDRTRAVLRVSTDPLAKTELSAAGSSDPDGDALAQRWWVYPEAGTYWGLAPIEGADTSSVAVTIPKDSAGRTIHVILEVTDRGSPPLTAYRRAILEVSGKRLPPPPSAALVDDDEPGEPITRLEGPPAKTGTWTFYRGINLNGKPVKIDGHSWDGDNARNFECRNRAVENLQVRLEPPTDPSREKMIRAFRWDRRASLTLAAVPPGTYAVYVYVWEETSPERFNIFLDGKQVIRDYDSGRPGRWRRLGPWIQTIEDGKFSITSRGGAANFCGIEVWRRASKAPR